MTSRKLKVLEYLKYERDERIPELIKAYGGDIQYVIDNVWGPLETCLDGFTDEMLIDLINRIMDDENYESNFKKYQEHMDHEDDIEELELGFVWECITNG